MFERCYYSFFVLYKHGENSGNKKLPVSSKKSRRVNRVRLLNSSNNCSKMIEKPTQEITNIIT